MKRRAVLGGLAAVATAGCISNPTGDESGGGSGDPGVRLARLSVKNEDSREHTIHVIVKRGGDIVHWSSHELAASGTGAGASRENLSCTWDGTTGQFEILARLDDASSWRSTVVAEDADCYQASVEIDGEGGLGVWYTTDCDIPASESCDVPTTTTESSN